MNFNVCGADYAVHGIQRGGNHAIINWILKHFRSYAFYNCCMIHEGRVSVHEQDLIKKGEEPHEVSIASFEDAPEKIVDAKEALQGSKSILILRDFYNTYASRFEKRRDVRSEYWLAAKWRLYDDTTMWKMMAKEFIGKNDHIKINYNMWFLSKQYRVSLSREFGDFSDEGLQSVSHFGGGSSFDSRKFDGMASEMNVMKRWVGYYNDREYAEKILSDGEAEELNQRIFGFKLPRLHL
jgi:hypothetical protein